MEFLFLFYIFAKVKLFFFFKMEDKNLNKAYNENIVALCKLTKGTKCIETIRDIINIGETCYSPGIKKMFTVITAQLVQELSIRWNNIERLDKKYASKYTDVNTLMNELYNNYYGKIVKKYKYRHGLSSHFRCLTKALIMTERRKLGLDNNSTKFNN